MSTEPLDRVLEKVTLGVLGLLVVFGPLATGAVRPQDLVVLQGLAALALLLWALRAVLSPDHRLLWPPACWAMLAFSGYVVVRALQSDLTYVAERELVRMLLYTATFFLVINQVRRQEAASGLVYLLTVLGILISAYAIYQFVTKSDSVWGFTRPEAYAGRGSGTYICPNHLAGFLAMLLPLTASVTLGGRTPVVGRLFLGYGVLVMLAGLGVTLSRGGWIAAGAGLFALGLLYVAGRQPAWRGWCLLAVLVLSGILVAQHSLFARQRASQSVENITTGDSVELRLSLWSSARLMWRDHFWWGVGPGHFDHRFPAYRGYSAQTRPGYAHNDYLNTLADLGLVGTLLLTVVLGATGFIAWQVLRGVSRSRDDFGAKASDRWALVTGAGAGLVSLAVHSVVDFNLQIPANALLAVFLVALVNAHGRYASGRYWVRLRGGSRWAVAVLMVALAIGLVLPARSILQESRWLKVAGQPQQPAAVRLTALQHAARIRPDNFETTHALGEAHRQISWAGHSGYEEHARQAIGWYENSAGANPFDPYNPARIAMCLDWLDRHSEALPYYERALELDPNNHYLHILRGWHHLQTEQYDEARIWFYRSLKAHHWPNPLARRFLAIAGRMQREQAANSPR
jgi:O-antigen ligase